MSATIIYGVVFGKPHVEAQPEPATKPQEMFDAYKADAAGFSDDVYYMSPPIQLPCDSEAEPN